MPRSIIAPACVLRAAARVVPFDSRRPPCLQFDPAKKRDKYTIHGDEVQEPKGK